MTTDTAQPAPGAKDATPNFPATSELVSGHGAAFVDSENLDARTYLEVERIG